MAENRKPRPATTIRSGNLKVTVWKNTTDKGDFYSVSPTRSFKRSDEGEWEENASFGRDDVLIVAELMRMAFAWIVREQAKADAERRQG